MADNKRSREPNASAPKSRAADTDRRVPRTTFPSLPRNHPLFSAGWIVGIRLAPRQPSGPKPLEPARPAGTPASGVGDVEIVEHDDLNTPEFDARLRQALEDEGRRKHGPKA